MRFGLCCLMVWLGLVLVGCGGAPSTLTPTTPPDVTMTPSTTGTPAASDAIVTPTVNLNTCSFVWDTHPTPEVTTQLARALREAQMTNVDVEVAAYGENCVDLWTNKVAAFFPRQTNYVFAVQIADTSDGHAMGEWIAKLINLLIDTPDAVLTGTKPGLIDLQFQDNTNTVELSFSQQSAIDLMKQGISGNALFNNLQQQP